MASGCETLPAIVQELQLLKHSLLPDERMTLLSPLTAEEALESALDALSGDDLSELSDSLSGNAFLTLAFELEDWRGIWFENNICLAASVPTTSGGEDRYDIMVKGENLGREDQTRWQSIVHDKRREVAESGNILCFS
ncbi:unnamed protein product [Peniophora sp. CBMAI 1063]|nr:unnamed protein product [Peniophora sp. CBMAI 1063]